MKKPTLPLLALLAFAIPVSAATIAPAAFTSDALKAAIASGRAAVIDCAIGTDELVRPMVNGGSHITQFMID